MAKNLHAAKLASLLLDLDGIFFEIEAYDKMLSEDEKRLLWTVWVYNASIPANRLDSEFIEGDFSLPSEPGMGSANAVATLVCGVETSPKNGRYPDPVKAGELWLYRLRKKAAKAPDASAVVKAFLKFLPQARGRPAER